MSLWLYFCLWRRLHTKISTCLIDSKTVGFISWAICLGLVGRVIWIAWKILASRTDITFKHASAFTWWRRQVIRHDIAGMHAYFASLEIPVPDKIPSLTVHEEGQAIFNPPHMYRGELQIPRQQITNRKLVTHIYAVYVMKTAFPDPTNLLSFGIRYRIPSWSCLKTRFSPLI